MGIVKIQDLKDYWSTDITTNFPLFCSVFSRNRFFKYMVCYMLEKKMVAQKRENPTFP